MLLFLASIALRLGSCSTRLSVVSLLFEMLSVSNIVSYVISAGSSDIPIPERSKFLSLPRLACLILSLMSDNILNL